MAIEHECMAYINIDGDTAALACWLPSGHEGYHYDAADNVTWNVGKADE